MEKDGNELIDDHLEIPEISEVCEVNQTSLIITSVPPRNHRITV